MTWDATGQNLFVADRVSEFRSEVALFQLSVETGARRQFTFPAAGESDWMPAVSPDGQTLGYSRLAETGVATCGRFQLPADAGGGSRIPTK